MLKYSGLMNYKIRKIIGCFYLDLTASQSVDITGLSRDAVNRFFNILRKSILLENDKNNDIRTTI
jgi:hypothetical protein